MSTKQHIFQKIMLKLSEIGMFFYFSFIGTSITSNTKSITFILSNITQQEDIT